MLKNNWWRYPDKPQRLPPLAADIGLSLEDYVFQKKFNGWRCIVEHSEKNSIAVWSRHKKRMSVALKRDYDIDPELQEFLIDQIPLGSVLDGELINKNRTPESNQEFIKFFDYLYKDGKWLGGMPYCERLKLLYSQLYSGPITSFETDTWEGYNDIVNRLKDPCYGDRLWVEGVVLKRKDSKLIGDRSKSVKNPGWFKVLF